MFTRFDEILFRTVLFVCYLNSYHAITINLKEKKLD